MKKHFLISFIDKLRIFLNKIEIHLKKEEPKEAIEQPLLVEKPKEIIETPTPPPVKKLEKQIQMLEVELPESVQDSTYQDRKPMNELLKKWANISGVDIKELKARLRKHTGVLRIDYMTKKDVFVACEWIKENIQKEKSKIAQEQRKVDF